MTPEGRVKAKVKKALDTLGRDCWRFMPVQTGYGSPALDFLLAVRGRFVAIETKAPGKKLTPLQETTKTAIEDAGGIVLIVWDESSLEIAMKIILAMEFAPSNGQSSKSEQFRECLFKSRAGYTGEFRADRLCQEARRPGEQHVFTGYASQALDAATRRDHGASRAAPQRPPKSGAGGKN